MKNICAIITAAGLSSRMGDFKPLHPVDGKVSMIQKEVETFSEAGISRIIVVTGFRAADIETELAGRGVEFAYNAAYDQNEMFDSVCIGLRQALRNELEAVLITPVDVPMFLADTVKRLLKSEGYVRIPSDGKHGGHPLLLLKPVCEAVLRDSGDGGLKGALKRAGYETAYVPVNDSGAFVDFDKPEDYRKLKENAR